jgi:guanosine-3',5'-bis(diphosphate) 3'-pyrophosphohydrolase
VIRVEVLTQSNQKPKRDWLSIAVTPKAKSKIRLALKETQQKDGLYAKELLERRFKNKHIEAEESVMAHLVKKMGFKEVSDFYKQIADGKLDPNDIIAKYVEVRDHIESKDKETVSADQFNYESPEEELTHESDDVLTIDQNLKGIDYQLAPCCHPIYGDPIFGFVTTGGGIKIHRMDCPNAPEMRRRFGYRIVKARWAGKGRRNMPSRCVSSAMMILASYPISRISFPKMRRSSCGPLISTLTMASSPVTSSYSLRTPRACKV